MSVRGNGKNEEEKGGRRRRQKEEEGGRYFHFAQRGLGVCMFCPYSNGPDGTELRAEMKSSLMSHQRTDRLE